MEIINLKCPTCGKFFDKQLKEYTRRRKAFPDVKFFCDRSCAGKDAANMLHIRRVACDPLVYQPMAMEAARVSNTKYPDDIRPFVWFMRRISGRANGIDSDIDLLFLKELWNKQNGICALTGIKLVIGTKDKTFAASLDRIKSSLGYQKDNVQFVSCRINWAKGVSSDDDVKKFIDMLRLAA